MSYICRFYLNVRVSIHGNFFDFSKTFEYNKGEKRRGHVRIYYRTDQSIINQITLFIHFV